MRNAQHLRLVVPGQRQAANDARPPADDGLDAFGPAPPPSPRFAVSRMARNFVVFWAPLWLRTTSWPLFTLRKGR